MPITTDYISELEKRHGASPELNELRQRYVPQVPVTGSPDDNRDPSPWWVRQERPEIIDLSNISEEERKDWDLSVMTGFWHEDIQRARKYMYPDKPKYSSGQKLGSRLSGQLWNSTIGGVVQMTSGRDSSVVTDHAVELTRQWEKEKDVFLEDAAFDDQVNDWARQLMLPPEARESDYLKGEEQLAPFKDVESVLGPRDVLDTGNEWANGTVDVITGLVAFVTKTRMLQSVMPNTPPWAIWEAVSVANGGKPGESAGIYGALSVFGALIPKGGLIPKIKIAGKGLPPSPVFAKLESGAITGGLFGTSTWAAGGSTEEIVINTALPILLAGVGIKPEDWDMLKPRTRLELAKAVRDGTPTLKDVPVSEVAKAIGSGLRQGGVWKGTQKAGKTAPKAEGKGVTMQPVAVEGKQVVSELAENIEIRAIEAQLVNDIPGMATHAVSNRKAQVKRALDLGQDQRMKILRGEAELPKDLLWNAVVKTAERHATKMGDSATLIELASSGRAMGVATRAGQELNILADQNKLSAKRVTQEVMTARMGTPDGIIEPVSTKKLTKNLRKAEKALGRVEKKQAAKTIDTMVLEATKPPVKRIDRTKPAYGKKNRLVTQTEYKNILAEIAKEKTSLPGAQGKGLRRGGAYVPTAKDIARLKKIGLYHLEAMGRNFAEWSKAVKDDLGEWVAPHLQKMWKELGSTLGKKDGELALSKINNGATAGKPLTEMSIHINKLAESFVAQGINKRGPLIDAVHKVLVKIDPSITKRETMDAISGYGKYKPLNKDEVKTQLRDLKGQMQQVGKLEDMQAKQAPAKTGVERRIPSDTERQLIQQVNEAKKKGGYKVEDPERQLKSALDTVKTRLNNRIADLEFQIKTKTKIVKGKTAPPSDAETVALTARRDALKAEFDQIFGRTELTDVQRVNIAVKATEKSIAEYERRIQTGDLTPQKKTGKTPTTPELDALRARRDALKEQVKLMKDAQNPKKSPEEISLQSYKTRLKNDAAKLLEKIADGDFVKPEKKQLVLDAEATQLKYERDKAKRVVQAAREVLERDVKISTEEVQNIMRLSEQIEQKKIALDADPLNKQLQRDYGNAMMDMHEYQNILVPREHTWRSVTMDVLGLPTSIMTSMDLSFPFRQGWGSMSTKEFWQGFGEQFKYAWSDANLRNLQAEIHGSPRYALARSGGLRLTDLKEQLQFREEGMQSTLSDYIPIAGKWIRASQRAYTGMANYVRWNRFNNLVDMAELQGLDVRPGSKVIRDIANVVNITTGSGNLGPPVRDRKTGKVRVDPWVNISPALNAVMFSARKFSADVGTINPVTYVTMTPFARNTLIKQNLGSLGATVALLKLASLAGADIERDPRSSDFGKVKIGETRVDITGGKLAMITFIARYGSGYFKNAKTGKLYDLDDDFKGPYDPTRQSVTEHYFRGKAAPVAGLLLDVFHYQRDYKGDPVKTKEEIGEAVMQRFVPMALADIYDVWNDDPYGDVASDAALDIILSIMTELGHSVNTYESDKDK